MPTRMPAALVLALLRPSFSLVDVASRCGGGKTRAMFFAGDLSGCHFNVTVIPKDVSHADSRYCHLDKNGAFQGFFPDVVASLAERAKFTYTLQEPVRASCGPGVARSAYACGHDNVHTGVSDMAFADLFATAARANSSLLTQPIIAHTGLAFITMQTLNKKSRRLVEKLKTVFQPFSPKINNTNGLNQITL